MLYARINQHNQLEVRHSPGIGFNEFNVTCSSQLQIIDNTINTIPVNIRKAEKYHEISMEFEHAVTILEGTYTPSEIASWAKQEAEARAWKKDNNVPTPLLSAISSINTQSIGNLSTNIIYNSDIFAARYGILLGKKQNLHNKIKLALTITELNQCVWV